MPVVSCEPVIGKSRQRIAIPDYGALVISLDFELYWGVADIYVAGSAHREKLVAAHYVIPRLLDLFREFDISATWATVGMLFAHDESEAKAFYPDKRPSYTDSKLSSYSPSHQQHDLEERFHYAPDLIKKIADCARQEIATHTFAHYYCLEPGQDAQEFEADLSAAKRIAEKYGVTLRSIVFPRNQINGNYFPVLANSGIRAYRGNQSHWANIPGPRREQVKWNRRIIRLAEAYVDVTGDNTVRWEEIIEPSGLCNVRASRYMRPYAPSRHLLEPRRLKRIVSGIEFAAKSKRLFHLWWHPEDMGRNTAENFCFVRAILQSFKRCQQKYGMRSMSMCDVAQRVSSSGIS